MSVLASVAEKCSLSCPAEVVAPGQSLDLEKGAIVDCGAISADDVVPGRVSAECGRAAYAYIDAAVRAALAGHIAGIATAPISKESLHLAGYQYSGHTEILAELTGTNRFCMMMASDEITVSLATTHLPYAGVPTMITKQRLLEVMDLTVEALIRLGRTSSRLAVCGLNPHSGEHGLFGTEELEVIEPAVSEARERGMNVEGPLPPDTAFIAEKRKSFDAYIVMYHDQGLIPFKMLAFDRGVNITLGLPIVRTSVDHGTAFDIACTGRASAASLVQAVLWAVMLGQDSSERGTRNAERGNLNTET
jgi:4-hydroxythreonine-4-phosphate dehydrogenase